MKWQELSVAERVKLAQDIWESVAAEPNALPITDAERAYLDEQLAAYREDPTGVPWSEVRARLIQVKRIYQARRPAQRELDERVLRAVRSGCCSRQEIQDSSRTWFVAVSADARRIAIMRSLHRLEASGQIEQASQTRKPVIYRAAGGAQEPLPPAMAPDGSVGALDSLASIAGDPVYLWPPLKRRSNQQR